jgi:peptide/nickel transport system ATP-binding protein
LTALLEIRDLVTAFKTDEGIVRAVDGVSMAIEEGQTLAVVGESGCGKTVTARSVLKLIDMPPGRFEAGQILWQGRDLLRRWMRSGRARSGWCSRSR